MPVAKRALNPAEQRELVTRLADALEHLNELEARMTVVEEKRMDRAKATSVARIALAAKRSNFETPELWLKHCRTVGWDNPERTIPAGWKPKPKRRRKKR